jgi:hypothetical protein
MKLACALPVSAARSISSALQHLHLFAKAAELFVLLPRIDSRVGLSIANVIAGRFIIIGCTALS